MTYCYKFTVLKCITPLWATEIIDFVCPSKWLLILCSFAHKPFIIDIVQRLINCAAYFDIILYLFALAHVRGFGIVTLDCLSGLLYMCVLTKVFGT